MQRRPSRWVSWKRPTPSWRAPLKSGLSSCPACSRRLDHRVDQRVHGAAVGHAERAADAVEGVLAALVVLRALEVRQHLVVAPALGAAGRPVVVVGAVAADVDHRVDRARAAEHATARQVQPPVAEARLLLAVEVPVDARLEAAGKAAASGSPAGCPGPGLEHRDLDVGVLAQARGEHAARRAGADDHVVVHPTSFIVRQPDARPVAVGSTSPARPGTISSAPGR